MKAVLLAIMMLLSFAPHGAEAADKEVLTLSKKNTLVLRGAVSDSSIAKLQMELHAMSLALPMNATIYLVLDTPGGSVPAGLAFIDFTKAIPQKITTITVFAASMGFQIAENLGERLILPNGTLMSHRASMSGLDGQIPGELITRLNAITRMIDRMDVQAAKRMSTPLAQYKSMIHDELWMDGYEAVSKKAADKIVYARCDKTFAGTQEVVLGSFFGVDVKADMSNCPLISGAMNVRLDMKACSEKMPKGIAEEYAKAYALGKQTVVRQFITTGKLM